MTQYVVLGAGIIGLYTTFHLIYTLEVDPKEITILGEYFPGDQSINYTSPWAGGNFSCITGDDDDTLEFDKFTYTNLDRIYQVLGKGKGLAKMTSTEMFDKHPGSKKLDSSKSYFKNYKPLESLPQGVEHAFTFQSWNFNCPLFLANLLDHYKNLGVETKTQKLVHISEAYNLYPNAKVVFNCTGIGSRFLGGVEDIKVYPTRGQVVVVNAPHIQESRMRWGEDYATYVIPRPDSLNNEVILGGFMQKDNWSGDTFASQTDDVLNRMETFFPKIFEKPLNIIRSAAGLRPSREGGVRIEAETIVDSKNHKTRLVIHNYGASGYGYQSGLGMAFKAVNLYSKSHTTSKL